MNKELKNLKNDVAVQEQVERAVEVFELMDLEEGSYLDLLDALASEGLVLAPAEALDKNRNLASLAYMHSLVGA